MNTADYAHIPPDLKASAEWFLFKQSNGKPQLFSYRGKAIDTVNPRASGTFKEVCVESRRARYDGLAARVQGGEVKLFHESSTPEPAAPKIESNTAIAKAQHAPTSPSAPAPTAEDFADLPDQMVQARRWLVWKPIENKKNPRKKPSKVPFYVNGKPRSGVLDSPDDLANLATFDEALQALQTGQYAGLGFALGPDGTGNHWQGIDLDDVPSRPELQHLADSLPGYTEQSPSGKGMHAIGYGKPFATLSSNDTGIEAYSSDRYFTVTATGAGRHDPCDLTSFVLSQLQPAHSRGKPAASATEAEHVETVDPKTVTELRSALLSMPSDPRDLWVRMGHALKPLGNVGRGLWLEWSSMSEKFDAADAARTWDSFKPTSTDYRAVFAEAQRWGWINPLSNEATGGARSDFSGLSNASTYHGQEGKSDSPSASEPDPAPRQVDTAFAAIPEVWPEPVDPFVEHAAPQFPVDHLPKAMAVYCHELSAQSGFDAGGYGFALLVAASNLIDHRARLSIGPLNVPAFLWGGLVASAGAGKSPIMSAAMKFAHRVNDDLVHASLQEREAFLKRVAGMKQKEMEALDQPPWKQLIASDTTIEALGVLLKDNPTGLLLAYDELSEFVGRMDAYNGGTGKDRGSYLQAFDGGSKTINRKSSIVPLVVENFSVGVLAGVQPEKLAEMFTKAGGADGLFQRFIVYALPRPGDVNYAVSLGTFTETNCGQIFDRLHEWSKSGVISQFMVEPAVLPLMENYHRQIRIISQRTASSRLAEHYDKFPGFLARILFALHCMECAARGRFSAVVTVETFNRAHAVAHVLYRHSESVYEALGQQGAGSSKLMRAACEAILSKGWTKFKWGDLTRNATGWKEADDRQAHGAIDLLIEFDWLCEVMPERVPGRPGRRSAGVFVVNPLVHELFVEQSQRIVRERAARYAAIQEVAAIRRGRPW